MVSKTLYMKCTTDKYELPEAVAGSVGELARILNLSYGGVATMICKGICGYHKVVVNEPELYPDNDGGAYYIDPDTGDVVKVED